MQRRRDLKKIHLGLCSEELPSFLPQKVCEALNKGLIDWPPQLERRLELARTSALQAIKNQTSDFSRNCQKII
jgi:hypothetical protein